MARKKATESTETENTVTNETSATFKATNTAIYETETVENTTDTLHTENQTEEIKYIYVGASLPGIKANTVFTGKIPEMLDVPFIRELAIPLCKFTEFIKKKAVTDSREAFCYRKSAEYAKTLRK